MFRRGKLGWKVKNGLQIHFQTKKTFKAKNPISKEVGVFQDTKKARVNEGGGRGKTDQKREQGRKW